MLKDECETSGTEASPAGSSETAEDMHIEYTCYSDKGVREENQDAVVAGSWACSDSKPLIALALADGMGGYSGGQVAAKSAIQGFLNIVTEIVLAIGEPLETVDWGAFILKLFCHANTAVTSYANTYPELGTTLVALIVYEGVFHVASIGDSRAYLLRDGEVHRLTRDDSFVQNLIDLGLITAEEAENHPQSNIITRSLGPDEIVETLTVHSEPLLPDDILLLASDGFWKSAHRVILDKIGEGYNRPLRCLAKELVDTAKALGSDDNISVALLRVVRGRVRAHEQKTKTYWENKEKNHAETENLC